MKYIRSLFLSAEDYVDRVIVSQLIIAVFVNTVLNTLWLSLMYKMPFIGYLPAQLSKEVIATPLQILIIYFGLNSTQFERIKNKLLD
ncbi:hypothetical protein IMAU10031_01551 [Lactobacillus helveticus]|uniref:hypothetical protein n=1 Tax=Lactobacillus helveticus TaxID=1587 RepID=UPI001565B09F|nr:hypothetical protein [Lactobacillus helveticus]MCO0806450.1 hypothetical protein [Lactobacillus helveticus]NRO03495.1 hypothetical protein [Lactobacillus helveticus]NRO39292.1 hypothetical protein [Lactobacillus helveticus]NRO76686.1 hypothetical protein [Lactobacillus helveticus]